MGNTKSLIAVMSVVLWTAAYASVWEESGRQSQPTQTAPHKQCEAAGISCSITFEANKLKIDFFSFAWFSFFTLIPANETKAIMTPVTISEHVILYTCTSWIINTMFVCLGFHSHELLFNYYFMLMALIP